MRLDRARDRAGFARAIEAVFRIESARLIAGLMRLVRDVGFAKAELRAAESIEVIAATAELAGVLYKSGASDG